jgi:hypothetical protein
LFEEGIAERQLFAFAYYKVRVPLVVVLFDDLAVLRDKENSDRAEFQKQLVYVCVEVGTLEDGRFLE